MSILDTILGYKGDHPKDVARAYQKLNQELSGDITQREDEQWKDAFHAVKAGGGSPSALHDPTSGQSFQPEGPSELERWKSQIDGLITSGNPVLQQQGLKMISQYRNRATSPESKTDTRANAVKEYMFARENGYKGSFTDYKLLNKARMSEPQLVSVPESKSLRVLPEYLDEWKEKYGREDVFPFMKKEDIAGKVYSVDPSRAEEAGAARAVASEFENALFGEKGLYNDWDSKGFLGMMKDATKATWQTVTQDNEAYKSYEDSRQGFVALLAKSLGESGNLAIQDIERAKKLIPTLTLPLPDSPKVARMKLDMLNRIIDANDSGDYKTTKRLINTSLRELDAAKGPEKGVSWE